MSGGASPNPNGYTARNPAYPGEYGDTPGYGAPNSGYNAPDETAQGPWNQTFGWAPNTRISVNGTPDAMREQAFPIRQTVPDDDQPPTVFYRPLDADKAKRESDTHTVAVGWQEKKSSYKIPHNPREIPPPETRWTEGLSPATWSFTRPFDQLNRGYPDGDTGSARSLNGMHFSMADHRRDYPILGMQPIPSRRNTYRVDPAPWDANMYDVPDPSTVGNIPNGRIQASEIRPSSNGSFRLG